MAISLNTWYTASGTTKTNKGTTDKYETRIRYKANSQNISNNKTNVTVQLQCRSVNSSYQTYGYNQTSTIQGTSLSAKSFDMRDTNTWQTFGERTFDVSHDNDGKKTVTLSASFKTTATSTYSLKSGSVSKSVELPTIPRYSVIQSADNFNDEGNPTIVFTNPSNGYFSLRAKIEAGGNTQFIIRDLSKTATSCTFTLTNDERNRLRALVPNSNSLSVRFTICCMSGSTELSASYLDRTMTIINANPTFSNFTYKDNNSNTASITENNQVLIKGYSSLQATISSSNKMVALKSATASKYTTTLDSISLDTAYSSEDININIGTINSSGTKRLNIRAFDSRNNSTLVYKDITVYDYDKPIINATVTRLNNFESQTTLRVNGTYSKLSINNVNKNTITNLQYRYRETAGNWNSWTSLNATINDGVFSCTDIILSLDNTKSFEFEIKADDYLDTTTLPLKVDVGIPIFFISSNNKTCYINNKEVATFDRVYPIGAIYMSVNDINPSTLFGGTWERLGVGRTLVSAGGGTNPVVDTNNYTGRGTISVNSDWFPVNETGGELDHTLTEGQMPSHSHSFTGSSHSHRPSNTDHKFMATNVNIALNGTKRAWWSNSGTADKYFVYSNSSGDILEPERTEAVTQGGTVGSKGSGEKHNNMPPYLAVYMWKRTA